MAVGKPGITGMIITEGNMPTEEFEAVLRQWIREEIHKQLAEAIEEIQAPLSLGDLLKEIRVKSGVRKA